MKANVADAPMWCEDCQQTTTWHRVIEARAEERTCLTCGRKETEEVVERDIWGKKVWQVTRVFHGKAVRQQEYTDDKRAADYTPQATKRWGHKKKKRSSK